MFSRSTVLGLLVAAVLGIATYLLVAALLRRRSGEPPGRWAPPLIIGLGVAGAVILLRPTVVGGVFTLRIGDVTGLAGLLVAIGGAAAGAAFADYLLARFVPLVAAETDQGSGGVTARASIAWLVAGAAAIGGVVGGILLIDPAADVSVDQAGGLGVEIVHEQTLPGDPTDLVFADDRSGYIAFEDRVAHFWRDGDIADGFDFRDVIGPEPGFQPRGVTIADGYLFVSDQGGSQAEADGTAPDVGTVLRFVIGGDGSLSQRTPILDDVPVADALHGINGLATGPDGLVYLAVGGTREPVEPTPPNPEWLGTVLRFDTDGNDLEVYARGLRNVYDLEFDAEGRLWGADNDGPSDRGYRAEEILQIKEGAHYGYPAEGTFGPHSVRTDPALWAFMGEEAEGSAGIELGEAVGLEGGLLVGARSLSYFAFGEDEAGPYAAGEVDYQGLPTVLNRQGYFTVVEASEGLLYVGVNGLSLSSELYVISLED